MRCENKYGEKYTIQLVNDVDFDHDKPHWVCDKCGGWNNYKKIGKLNYYICGYCGNSHR